MLVNFAIVGVIDEFGLYGDGSDEGRGAEGEAKGDSKAE